MKTEDTDKTGAITFKDLSLRLKAIHCFVFIRSAFRKKRIADISARHLAEMRKTYRVQRTDDGWSCNFGSIQ